MKKPTGPVETYLLQSEDADYREDAQDLTIAEARAKAQEAANYLETVMLVIVVGLGVKPQVRLKIKPRRQ